MQDDFGNSLHRDEETDKIKLILASEGRVRNVGRVDQKERVLVVYRSYENHLFKTSNAFGFNHQLLKEATMFDDIFLTTDREDKYKIPVNYILKNGKFLMFKQQGFEVQIFVTVEEIQQFKIN